MLYTNDESLSRAGVLDRLATMPARLRETLEGAAAVVLERPPSPGAWSAFQTICHVRDAAFIYAIRFRWIVFDDNPFLPNYDENNWVAAARDTVTDLPGILDEIAASRADLMRVLSRLPEVDWQRTGRHEIMGTVTLDDYVRHQVVHEHIHLAQIGAALRGS